LIKRYLTWIKRKILKSNPVFIVSYENKKRKRESLFFFVQTQTKCPEDYEAGTPSEQVNTVVGEYYKELNTSKRYT
jgi:hypothetical protein